MADTKAESIQDQGSMTIASVAAHIGKSSGFVTKLLDNGTLTGIKFNERGHRRVTIDSFVRYCNVNRIALPAGFLPPRKVVFILHFNFDLLKNSLPQNLLSSIELVSFQDLERAIANIGKKKPSLILISIGDKDLRYYETVFREVRASHPDVKFAVVSKKTCRIQPDSSIDRVFTRKNTDEDKNHNATYELFDYIGSV
jgi:hypothetical protein